MADAVRFENVTKYYPRGGNYASLRQDLVDGVRRIGARVKGKHIPTQGAPALSDMSFQIGEGESVALVGPNGAGKTTALKLISRISYPSAGRVLVRGRVGALIEIHAGIHPELTGRENVALYGRILGMSKRDIRARFDSIVEFAELQRFIDVPVKRYSSGMQLRLGFSIASHLDPEVFVVDEALSVGDAWFQARCVDRMRQLLGEGRTLVFVSHDLHLVESVCPRVVLIRDGTIADDGPSDAVIARYFEWVEERQVSFTEAADPWSTLQLVRASCRDLAGKEQTHFRQGEGLEIQLAFVSNMPLARPHVHLAINDQSGTGALEFSMDVDGAAPAHVGTEWSVTCRIEELPLRPRMYEVYCGVGGDKGGDGLFAWKQIAFFRVTASEEGLREIVRGRGLAPVSVPYSWNIDTGLSPLSNDLVPLE